MANELNLALVVGGFTTIGGMVYGGYELLKNEPREVTELMQIKKRAILTDADTELGKQSGEKYITDHTKTVEVKPTEEQTPAPSDQPAKPKPKETKKEIDTNDAGGLLKNWQEEKRNSVPQELKDNCNRVHNSKENGIGTAEYKRFENYCTKDASED